jgi:E-phenylitaconyl-CoA hydratase
MIHIEVDDYVATVTIDRQDRLNALDPASSEEMQRFWQSMRTDKKIRVAIVTGAGERAFSAGFDIKWAARGFDLDMVPVGGLTKEIDLFKPVIAAVNGLAYGGGCELMLATDLRVAVPEATFALSEVRWGVIPGGGGCVRLPYQLPWAIANEMILRGRVLTAEEAERHGLVNAIVPREQLMDTAREWAQELVAKGPIAIRTAKEIMWRSRGMDPNAALRLEERFSYAAQVSEDGREGIRAFNENRKANFADS